MKDHLTTFCAKLTERANEYKKALGLTYFDEFKVEVTEGKKYWKVCRIEMKGGQPWSSAKSIIAFVDKINGSIFKPASWALPAKGVRGNISSTENGMEAIGQGGFVNYLR